MDSKLKRSVIFVLMMSIISTLALGGAKDTFEGTIKRYIEPGPANYVRPGVDGFSGRLLWLAPLGTFAKGPIYDSKGNIIRKGDIIAKCDTRFYEYFVEQAKAEIKSKKGLLVSAKYELGRSKKLLPTHAISKKELDIAQADYMNAVGELEAAKANLEYQNLLLEMCTMRAQQNCFVVRHLNVPGSWCNIDYPVMIVMPVSPLYVEVKMDRQLVKKLWSGDYCVKVFPVDSDKPVYAFQENCFPYDNGIKMPVPNRIIPPPENIDIPIISGYGYVGLFDLTLQSGLAVTTTALNKDDKGYYVWNADGISSTSEDPLIDCKIKVKKVYVKPADKVKYINPIGNIRELKDAGGLKQGDIVLNKNIPENLKDGDFVFYHKVNVMFWPGDKVKVIIPGLTDK